jgi:hypothetical protein
MLEFRRPLVGVLLALCASASVASRSIAPPGFDDEMSQTHQDNAHLSMALWLSTAMFKRSVAGDMKPADVKMVVDALKGYAIFGILDVTLDGTQAAVNSADRATLRSSARLQLGARAPRAIVREADLPPGVRAAVQVFKPMMASMLGKFGDSMEFVVFNDADEHGNSLADPRGSLVASLSFDKESFAWRCRWSACGLQPLRSDPATGDTFPGDFDFSPFTGNKLAPVK